MARETQHRADPDLVELLVTNSRDTVRWMRSKGVRFAPMYGRQAFKFNGRFKFWGGLTVEAVGGGPGLVAALQAAVATAGITIAYESRALVAHHRRYGRVVGVRVRHDGRTVDVRAQSVVLAAGGFQANTEWRTRYLGPGWELAKVRGTRFNTGDGIRMALDAGRACPPATGRAATRSAGIATRSEFGDLDVGDNFQKHSYPFGIMLNANGERFVDEGADVFSYTYSRYGRVVLVAARPVRVAGLRSQGAAVPAWRVSVPAVTRVRADTLEELVAKLEDVDPVRALATIHEFNAATRPTPAFDPNVKDGRGTVGLADPEVELGQRRSTSRRSRPMPSPAASPSRSVASRSTPQARVIDVDGRAIPGLFAAGEMVGGLYYFGYPSGSGLMSGAVFGRTAGRSAAAARGGRVVTDRRSPT